MVSGIWFLSLEKKKKKRDGVKVLVGNLIDSHAWCELKVHLRDYSNGSRPRVHRQEGCLVGAWVRRGGLPGSSSSGRRRLLAYVH